MNTNFVQIKYLCFTLCYDMYILESSVVPSHAMTMPPSSESENLSRNVPFEQVPNNSSACFFLTKPRIHLQFFMSSINIFT